MSEARRSGIRKALRAGVEIVRSTDYAAFWKILSENLLDAPRCCAWVHSLEEITALARMYSTGIALHAAMLQGRMLGAAVVYVTDRVVHTQYISASPLGKSLGAIDLLYPYPCQRHLQSRALLRLRRQHRADGTYAQRRPDISERGLRRPRRLLRHLLPRSLRLFVTNKAYKTNRVL